jgi:hypothetical protein
VKVAAVLLEAETWGAEASSLDIYGTLAAGGIYTYTVKRADDFARILSVGSDLAGQEPVAGPPSSEIPGGPAPGGIAT